MAFAWDGFYRPYLSKGNKFELEKNNMCSSIIYMVHWVKLKFVAYSIYLYTPAEKFMSIIGGLR